MQHYTSQPPIPNTSRSAVVMAKNNNQNYPGATNHNIQSMYTERPLMAPPMEPWLTVGNQAQQNYNSFAYDTANNSSNNHTPPPLPTPPATSSHFFMNNGPMSTNLTDMTTSPTNSAATASVAMSTQPLTPNNMPHSMLSSNYMASSTNSNFLQSHVVVAPQQPNFSSKDKTSAQQQLIFSPSPSPTLCKRGSFGSESSSTSFQLKEEETMSAATHNGKRSNTDRKRDKVLERNRQAALRCRQRKKEWLNRLQNSVETLTRENRALEQQSLSLREEILNLKTLLLAHRDCSHAHLTNNSINLDNLMYRTSQTTLAAAISTPTSNLSSPTLATATSTIRLEDQ